MGRVKVSTVEDSYSVSICDRKCFEEFDEAIFIVDLRKLVAIAEF